ncbi:fumarylacetoacetate hydrolase family protein [Pseudonocardia sp. Cha107L01]|uniref:fumarylacetoacetate hydrolase family protein n=1 Tax=Pseudonocardia sp. Cha107L01 TaxID=3457576 RepID=UPI00403EB8E7
MRVARVSGRLSLLVGNGAVDVHAASDGRFPADPDAVFDQWDELREWAGARGNHGAEPYSRDQLGAPVLNPKQVFAIGLNYRDHAAESGVAVPSAPAVFTKFATCLTGPYDTVQLPSDKVDWEVELVVVIGRRAWQVSEESAWSHVAGLTVGQDLSERAVQLVGPVPQFSLGKSYPGFGPIGPAIVTSDELADPDDLSLICALDEELLQKGRTRDMVFSVSELIARLSAVCPLLPGDVIFTGTPPGVGMARTPARYLTGDTTLVSAIDGIGELRNPLIAK